MRDGIVVVDADGHVMDRPHRCYQKYILYASDYPHWDSEWPHTVDELMKRGDLTHGQKAKILGGNALGFYGLPA
jgi:predicted TIM-barrel fold metal-dependent hydrolase